MKQLGFAKVGIIVMVLTSAVAAIGMGFGLWAQVLSIQGIVGTGTVDAKFSDVEYGVGYGEYPFTNDDGWVDNPLKDWDDDGYNNYPEPEYDAWEYSTVDPSGPAEEEMQGYWFTPRSAKDVARCYAFRDEGETILEVYVEEAYPSYWCTAWFHVRNFGSVPLKLQSATLLGVPAGDPPPPPGTQDQEIAPSEWWCIDTDGITPPVQVMGPHDPCPEIDGDDPLEEYDLKVHLSELVLGVQIDPTGYESYPEDGANVQGNIDIHVEQGAAQNGTLEFELEMLWVQWNEYSPPPPL